MTGKIFLILIITIQLFFLTLDFISIYFDRNQNKEKTVPLKTSSIMFLVLVALFYGVIQFGGLALIPKTEVLIEWFNRTIPSISLFNLSPDISLLGWLMLGIFTFYIAGFWDYATHRFLSHSRSFFFTHEYHHLPNKLFLALPGISVRPFVVIATLPATLATVFSLMVLLKIFNLQDIDLMPLVYILILIQSIILAVTHSAFFMGQWWMYRSFRYLGVTSPQEHEMHHAVDLRGNYANFTIVWDKLFRTYVDPTKPENQNHAMGLGYDQDFLGALTAGKIKLSQKIRNRFQIERYCNIKKDQK
jgi:sterol desaturase/sphingolipid hydroxylase (fatty acid hydroxylase superfamily)